MAVYHFIIMYFVLPKSVILSILKDIKKNFQIRNLDLQNWFSSVVKIKIFTLNLVNMNDFTVNPFSPSALSVVSRIYCLFNLVGYGFSQFFVQIIFFSISVNRYDILY